MGFFDFITKKIAKTNGVWFNKPKKASSFDKDEFKKAFAEIAPEVYRTIQQQNRGVSLIGFDEVNSAAELYNWLSYSGTGFDSMGITQQAFFSGTNPDGSWIPISAGISGGASTGPDGNVPPPPNNFGNLPVTDKTKPVAKKPKEVIAELDTVAMPWNLTDLDEKIAVMKDKQSLTLQRYANAEITGMIDRLENRKKYTSVQKFFEQFPNTTDEKIEALIKKYPHLKLGSSELFVPEFPNDAVKAMREYTEHCKTLCNKKPVFYVIAQKKDFEKNIKKRDPILLVQSPFGMYWQILGAWDEEMVLLSEL